MPEILTMLIQIDQYLGLWVEQYGAWIYLILFCIIFSETGLVVFPFLPGDSLLFIAGAFGATGTIDPVFLAFLLLIAATLGNTTNYYIGRYLGPKVFTEQARFLDKKALIKTHAFYAKNGGKTLVISRFLPIFLTFSPFVAGVGRMHSGWFQFYIISGAVIWICGFIALGYYFGHVPIIRDHLNTIVLVGIGAAAVPVALGLLWRFVRHVAARYPKP